MSAGCEVSHMPTKLNHQNGIFRICVDHVDEDRVSGRVFSRRLTAPILFSDLGGLLLQLENLLESQNFPQSFQRIRSFRQQEPEFHDAVLPENALSEQAVRAAKGERATCVLSVVSRQNATWQGTIDWLDGAQPKSFSSDLEFLKLLETYTANL